MKQTYSRVLVSLALCVMIASVARAQPLATVQETASGVQWLSAVSDIGLVLTVSGPDGSSWRQEIAPGERPVFSIFDEGGALRPEGVYVWELRSVARLDAKTLAKLSAARESGDEDVLRKVALQAPAPRYASGSFSILDGQVFAGSLREAEATSSEGGGSHLSPKGVLSNSNGVIRNALCVGFDCPDSPAFGDSSVLMMENNNRIKFGDTSVSPFPNNDWEIEANSSSSGGQSYLGFNDCGTNDNDGSCTTDLVFAVEAGARQNALYVESDGDVGIGTSNPVLDLHIVTGDSPGLRLDQASSSGFAPQTWDVAGNETSFFVRDVTNGSTLPFRIRPGAASNRLVIDADGDVGIGVLSPERPLDVVATNAPDNTVLEVENNGAARIRIRNGASGETWNIGHQIPSNTGLTFSDVGDAVGELLLDVDGNLTIAGQIFTSGSCSGGCDVVFDPGYELESIEEHTAAMLASRHLPAVGPTSEDGPFNLSQMTGGMLNELEKAHLYIAQLNGEKIRLEKELRAQIAALEEAVRTLQEDRDR